MHMHMLHFKFCIYMYTVCVQVFGIYKYLHVDCRWVHIYQ